MKHPRGEHWAFAALLQRLHATQHIPGIVWFGHKSPTTPAIISPRSCLVQRMAGCVGQSVTHVSLMSLDSFGLIITGLAVNLRECHSGT